MSPRRVLTALLWFFAAAGLFMLGTLWAIGFGQGLQKVWPFIPVLLGAVMLAAVAHYLTLQQDPLRTYRQRHKPLAGPKPGAALPD
ncbi:MAG TPA: hypothetical protein VG900_03450 [Hyphomicrobiaceae bacterium]|jgi:hypothetical protein|nr:hypothetical protein [Hyphomicrobiaceae bacterium]